MKRLLYDTGVYVDYLRRGESARLLETSLGCGVVHLSAVVAEELLVGAPTERAARFLHQVVGRFDSLGRLEVPTAGDWLRVGDALRQVGQRHGYEQVRRARLTNDALLAAALRLGATVVTRNPTDFVLLHDFLPASILGV